MKKKLFIMFAVVCLAAALLTATAMAATHTEDGITYEYDEDDDNSPATVTGFDSSTEANILASFDSHTVTAIGDSAFAGCTNLRQVNIPDSIESIGYRTFADCTNLETVNNVGGVNYSNLQSIGEGAFYNCYSLTGIVIPNVVTTIGKDAFNNCTELTNVTIPGSVTDIGDFAFAGCSALTNVTISEPSQLNSIGKSAFINANKLASINIPASVTTIGEQAFSAAGTNSASGFAVTIAPASRLTSIGKEAFKFCSKLNSIEIPGGVTTISDNMFEACYNLSSVTLNSGIQTIGKQAFSNCSKLTSVTIPASVTTINDGAFFNAGSGVSSFTVEFEEGSLLTQIGNSAFINCTKLDKIKFACADVPTAGAYAFMYPTGPNQSDVSFLPNLVIHYPDSWDMNDLDANWPPVSGSNYVSYHVSSPSGGGSTSGLHDGIGSVGADACYYDADTDSMDDGVKQITYGDAAYYPLLINRSGDPVTDRRMVEGLKIKAKYTEGEDLIEGEPQLVKVCVDGVYQYFIKFNVKQTLDAQLRDVCGTLTLNKSKRDKKDSGDFRVKDLTVDFDFEVGAKYNYADDTRLVIDNDPEIPLWPNEFFILKYDCGEEVEFEFGLDSNEGTFTVDVSGQGKNLITFNTEIEENVAAANPDAKMIAISFNNVRFNRTGVLNYEADDMNYAYEIKNGKLVKIAEFANGEVEFNTNTLGRYIFSDIELVSPETIGEAVFVRLT